MLRKVLLLTLAAGLLLGGCSLAEKPEDTLEKTANRLSAGWETALQISAGETQAAGRLYWMEEEQTLCYDSPETIAGLCFSRSPSGVTVSMEGLSQRMDAGELLDSAVARGIFAAFDGLVLQADPAQPEQLAQEGLSGTRDGCILLSGKGEAGEFRLLIDEESALPRRLELEAAAVDFLPEG